MNNNDKVVSGFKNKMNAPMSNITPDSELARQFDDKQKPVGED